MKQAPSALQGRPCAFTPQSIWGVLKFLAFEQVFQETRWTTLPMGGGQGGSTFDPQSQEAICRG